MISRTPSSEIATGMDDSSSREYTDAKRFQIYCDLKGEWDGINLRRAAKGKIAKRHNVTRQTVSKYWNLGNDVSALE